MVYRTLCSLSKNFAAVNRCIYDPVVTSLQPVSDCATNVCSCILQNDTFVFLRSLCLEAFKTVLSWFERLQHLLHSTLQVDACCQPLTLSITSHLIRVQERETTPWQCMSNSMQQADNVGCKGCIPNSQIRPCSHLHMHKGISCLRHAVLAQAKLTGHNANRPLTLQGSA